MTSEKAWVTLATNDTYSLGALVLAHSLRKVKTSYKLVVLVTSNVSYSMRGLLQGVYDEVKEVNLLDSGDAENLRLLARPELGVTFTKLHCWKLTQYEKCVFLDADTLVLQNCDELFDREELSAAPDVGWPDCFNSGVFVFKPSEETYQALINFALTHGSFDGGDQGLLNMFFSDWATGDSNKRLPFLFNLSSAAIYSYLPAFKWYGKGVKIVHFIGGSKPWLQPFNPVTRQVQTDHSISHLNNFLQYWWDLFCTQIHPYLSPEMSGLAQSLSQMKLEEPTPEQLAQEDLQRRTNWEQGNIDYMGKDSFDNIWSKISQSISQAEEPPASDKVLDTVSPATVSPTPVTPTAAAPVSVPAEPAQKPTPLEIPVAPPKVESPPAAQCEIKPSLTLGLSDPKEVVEPAKAAEVPASPSQKEAQPVTPSQKEAPVSPSQVPVSLSQVPVSPSQVPVSPSQVPISPSQVPVSPSQVPVSPTQVPASPSQKEAQPVTPSQKQAEPPVTPSLVSQPESAPVCVKPSPVEKQKSQSEAAPTEAPPKPQEPKPSTEPSSITPSSPKLPEAPAAVPDLSKIVAPEVQATAATSTSTDPKSPLPADPAPVEAKTEPSVPAPSTPTAQETKSKQQKSGGGKKK